jgi:hypothetical protein
MRVVFLQSIGLGDHVAEVDDVEDLPERQAQEYIYQGRAVLAPGEVAPEPRGLTTEAFTPDPTPPKKGGRK